MGRVDNGHRRKNRDILSGGKKYAENKSKKFGVEEVVFDKGSREEYLTGFHKRKLERQKKAQEYQKEQGRLAKIEERKAAKLDRERHLAEQMVEFNEKMKEMNHITDESSAGEESSEEFEEWDGFQDENATPTKSILKRKEVYVTNGDEDDATEVIIEDLSYSDNIEEIAKKNNVNLAKSKQVLEASIARAQKYAKYVSGLEQKKEKKKKKKFRYLTKTERRSNNHKAISNKRRSQ